MNVFDDEYWLPCYHFPLYKISSFGRIIDTVMDEEVTPTYFNREIRVILKYGPDEFRGAVWQMMYATFWQSGWGIDVTVAYRDGDSKNLSIFNLLFEKNDKPLMFVLDGATGLWRRKRKMARRVRIVETGEEFDSVLECATAIGGYKNTIYMCLRGQQETSKGYRYEWIDD